MADTKFEYKNYSEHEVKYVPTTGDNVIELKPEDKIKRPDTLFLYFTVIIAILPMLITGASIGWFSPGLIKLQSNDTNVNPLGKPITASQLSLLIGIPNIIALIGTSILPKLADVIGRKYSMLVLGYATFFSIIGLALINSFTLLLISSTFLGVILSGLWNILPVYVTEICEDHNRAKFGCLLSIFLPLGELYAFAIGPEFSYKNFTLLTVLPLTPFLLLFYLLPESPAYSLSKGKKDVCNKALKRLRSNKTKQELEMEVAEIQETLDITSQSKGISLVKLFYTKEGRLGVMLGSIPTLVQLLCGVFIMTSLLAPIFDEAGSNLSGNTIAVIVGVAKIVSYIIASLVIEKLGRRQLLIWSSLGTGISITVLGIFYYLKYINSPVVLRFQWVPIAAILVYFVAFSLGVGPVPTVIISELFPPELRATAFAFITTWTGLVFAVYAIGYPLVAEAVGTHWCMWIFGATCFLGAILIHILLPETRGKSITEIQEILKNY